MEKTNEGRAIVQELQEEIIRIKSLPDLMQLKAKYLGKNGKITFLSREMSTLGLEEKKEYGIFLNALKEEVLEVINEKETSLEEEVLKNLLEKDEIDITLPSSKRVMGSLHPLTMIREELEDLFVSMGYDVWDGPEIDSDLNCFERLNLPKGHPARDAQDTFYIDDEFLLRPHTSPVQVRAMLKNEEKTPFRIVCPGKVYRRDDDATHSHQFMQFEGLAIGEGLSLADLKGTLEIFARKLLGEKTEIRFRPSYFPFTEPSCEVDVSCFKCGGKGCNLCKNTGWIEVLGAGMVHPNVLEMCGYDKNKYTAFAFGPGLDRFSMFKYNINDIRQLYTNDIRFLKQFGRVDKDETKY